MPNRVLDVDEMDKANELLDRIRDELLTLANGDPDLLFAYRRKVSKMLSYDERSSPIARRKLKAVKRSDQNGMCDRCSKLLPERYAVLDRLRAADGYTPENTRLLCYTCDREVQSERGFA